MSGKKLLVLPFTLCFIWVFSQQKFNPDSLQRIIPELPDTAKMRAYQHIARYWVGVDKKQALEAAGQALVIAETWGDPVWIARSLNVESAILNIHGESPLALPKLQRALELAKDSGHKMQTLESLENLAVIYSALNQWDKAVDYAQQGLYLSLELKDTVGILNNYNSLGHVYLALRQLVEARSYFRAAVDLVEQTSRLFERGRAYANLGLVMGESGDHQGEIFWEQKAREAFRQFQYPLGEVQVLLNLGEAFYKTGDLFQSRKMVQEALAMISGLGSRQLESKAHLILGEVEMESNNLKEAEVHLKLSEEASKQSHDFSLLQDTYLQLLHIALIKADYDLSRKYRQAFEAISDSLINEKVLSKTAEYQVRYQTAEKEADLNQRSLQLEKEKNRRNFLAVGLMVVILVSTGWYQFTMNRQKIREKESELALQLEQTKAEKLKELDQMKSTFFANISHEFRTPLTLILSPVEQMIQGTLKGDYGKYLRIIRNNGRRLLDLVNQLLELSKLESGRMELIGRAGDLDGFIRGITGSFESLASSRNIQLLIQISTGSIRGYFDRDKVEKILTNLLANAFKYSREGDVVRVEWMVSKVEKDGTVSEVVIKVMDTGIGILPEHLPHIFERFTHSQKSEIQAGSGLGLAITRSLVELCGGKIDVESNPGSGTVFTFNLNVHKSFFNHIDEKVAENGEVGGRSEVIETYELEDNALRKFPGKEKPIIVLAEDHQEVRQYVREVLSETYDIRECRDGAEAWEMAQRLLPDLIISDVMMPVMSGIELCAALKNSEKTSHIPLILLTARAEQEYKLTGLRTGADDYLQKPFDAEELCTRIQNLLQVRLKLQEYFRRTLHTHLPEPVHMESMDAQFLNRFREIVESNLDDENFSVVELSHHMQLSRSQLHRKLVALTGHAPTEIIRQMRLERAKVLIRQKTATMAEIAYACGFSSPAYFARCFREYFGVAPTEMSSINY